MVAGVKAAAHAAFVLVAGGLGERLGYSGIKLALPADSARSACFLQVCTVHVVFTARSCQLCTYSGLALRCASRR